MVPTSSVAAVRVKQNNEGKGPSPWGLSVSGGYHENELSPRRETQNLQPSHMRVTAESDSQMGGREVQPGFA